MINVSYGDRGKSNDSAVEGESVPEEENNRTEKGKGRDWSAGGWTDRSLNVTGVMSMRLRIETLKSTQQCSK